MVSSRKGLKVSGRQGGEEALKDPREWKKVLHGETDGQGEGPFSLSNVCE